MNSLHRDFNNCHSQLHANIYSQSLARLRFSFNFARSVDKSECIRKYCTLQNYFIGKGYFHKKNLASLLPPHMQTKTEMLAKYQALKP